MKRDISQVLLGWKQRKGRKPLIVRGARQVGKTYSIEQFGKEEFVNFIKVNLEEKPEIKSLFAENNSEKIIKELSVLYNIDIEIGKTLLFIDEIQSCADAIVALRYFYEQIPELHVVAAGSLLDHALNEMKLSMPVGRVEFCFMQPMNFKEFLWALGEGKLIDYMEKFTFDTSISEALHKKFLDLLRYYIFIGGMPEAVKSFTETNKLLDIERVHQSILTSLQYDFAKYGSRSEQIHLINTLRYVAQNPGKKIKYVNIDSVARSAQIKEALRKLEMSRVVFTAKHTGSAGVPISTNFSQDVFKTFFLDVGLSNRMCNIQLTDPLKILTINEGALAEQFVAQELMSLFVSFVDPALFYWIREEKNSNAEVDFLFQNQNNIYPIEVKAGKTGTLKSMHVYLFEKKLTTGVRFNTDIPSIGTFSTKVRSGNNSGILTYKLISLPLYMVSQLPRLLNE
jgi:predicted AAA+ superfamily ATPase